jgi:DNA-binding CsgD family transcriptional regulator
MSDSSALPCYLTPSERKVLTLVEQGKTTQEIAEQLFIQQCTVSFHLRNIYKKLGVNNRSLAIMEAKKRGFM